MLWIPKRLAALALIGVSLLASVSAFAQSLEHPGLEAARSYSRGRDGLCLLIFQQGHLLVEDYYNGSGPARDHHVFSITKNLWGLAAAEAAADGLIKWEELVSDTISEWQDDPRKRDVTIQELLSMTSGIDPGFSRIYRTGVLDKNRAAVGLPLRATPGRVFDYGPGGIELFGEILKRKLSRIHQTPEDYLRRKLLLPAGITVNDWRKDESGNVLLSAGARMTARNLLRLGTYVLKKGSGRFEHLFQGSSVNPAYGLTFWLNNEAGSSRGVELNIERILERPGRPPSSIWRHACVAASAPKDMVTMLGSGNQRVYVVPSMDAVIVRLGFGETFDDGEFWRRLSGTVTDVGG